MNTYKAFYKGQSVEVEAETTLAAQAKGAAAHKAKKQSQVDVYLVALAGVPYVHTAV